MATKIISNTFEKRINDACGSRVKIDTLIGSIQRFFDKNHNIIFAQGPSLRLMFTENEKQPILDFTGISFEETKECLSKVKIIDASWKKLNEPFIIQSVLVIRELTKRKLIKERDQVIMFLAARYYALAQVQFFKYEPNEQVMNYTLNNLSDKFKYKTLLNNYAVLKDTALTSHNTYETILLKGEDEMFPIYVQQMENRIYKLIKNIAILYYDNLEKKHYLNLERGTHSDTGDERDIETSSSLINDVANGAASEFMSRKPNMGLIKLACEKNEVSFAQLHQCLINIKQHEEYTTIERLFISILSLIFDQDTSSISNMCSTSFTVKAISLISIRNSIQVELENIKNTLDKLLVNNCAKYVAVQRLATKMAYRNALYSYFVYLMIMYRCH